MTVIGDGGRSMGSSGEFEHLAQRIDAVVEELDELQLSALREAVAAKSGRPASDQRVTQARRALEKAAHLLRHDPR